MWLLHIGGTADGPTSVALNVGLFLLLLVHSLGFVLLFQQAASKGQRLAWGLVLLVPLLGPAAYLVHRRPHTAG